MRLIVFTTLAATASALPLCLINDPAPVLGPTNDNAKRGSPTHVVPGIPGVYHPSPTWYYPGAVPGPFKPVAPGVPPKTKIKETTDNLNTLYPGPEHHFDQAPAEHRIDEDNLNRHKDENTDEHQDDDKDTPSVTEPSAQEHDDHGHMEPAGHNESADQKHSTDHDSGSDGSDGKAGLVAPPPGVPALPGVPSLPEPSTENGNPTGGNDQDSHSVGHGSHGTDLSTQPDDTHSSQQGGSDHSDWEDWTTQDDDSHPSQEDDWGWLNRGEGYRPSKTDLEGPKSRPKPPLRMPQHVPLPVPVPVPAKKLDETTQPSITISTSTSLPCEKTAACRPVSLTASSKPSPPTLPIHNIEDGDDFDVDKDNNESND